MASLSSVGSGRGRDRRGRPGSRSAKAAGSFRPTSSPLLATLGDALGRPLASYYLVLVSTTLLVGLGALMVLSASSAYAQANGQSPYFYVQKQILFLVVGVPSALGLSRLNPRWLVPLSWLAMGGSVLLLVLIFVPGLGSDAGKGNLAWLDLGVITLQPSEFAKVGLVMWSAAIAQTKQKVLDQPRELVPLVVGFAVVMGLVLAQKDLGTTLVLVAIFFGVLWILGVPGRMLALLGAIGALGVGILVATSPNRMTRILQFIGKAPHDLSASQQPMAAIYALASGGWWGVGLGGSRQKWGNLYDGAQNDYVFAVLGEEMGLVGTVLVILLFAVLGLAGFRIALRSDSLFNQVLSGAISTWLMFQAMVNIAVAMKLLPVLGVPLPFISYGGSALLANLLAIGLLLACARQEPAARRSLARRRGEPAPRVTTVVDGGHR